MTSQSQTSLRTTVSRGSPHNACLSALSARAFSLLKPHLTITTYHEGSVLWDANRPTADVYFPVSGSVSMVVSVSEASIEVAQICKEAAVGAIIEPAQPDFYIQGVVQVAGDFILAPASQVSLIAQHNREIDNLLTFCRDWVLFQAQQIAACNAVHTTRRRVCRWLFGACERLETDHLPITQETVASILGIRRTTVTLIAQKLQAEELIQYRRGRISVLDRPRLRTEACECCESLSRQHWPSTRMLNPTASTPRAHF